MPTPPVAQLRVRTRARFSLSTEELQAFSLRHQLCPRERQIVQLTAEGSSRKEMAKRLGLKPTTINTYCDRLHKKLGVQHATELSSLIYELWS